ncbi:mechanosensitive ion channel family protein [Paenibacillus caui]|uniref:mechanosensitive ion channel family protein n=1 Tax=Paenibacillus caui TaxID=2873927 RepID=UPI001CA8F924|nr:mechanosensitive ion channel family protein [Paenibacillus caui]
MKIWEWTERLFEGINAIHILISVGIIVLFLLLSKVFSRWGISMLNRWLRASDSAAVWTDAFRKPLRLFFTLLGVYLGIKYLLPAAWESAVRLDRIFRSVIIILLGWGTYIVSSQSSVLLVGIGKKLSMNDTGMLIPFLTKVLRFIVVIVTIGLVGSEWGFSVNGLVAGMGLGSLAIALAAKDTLGNILGGIVIIIEKPFSKGDWILTPTVEGVVEDITFRSTQIRTFADAVITVPNSQMADQPITNWSKMGKRRITFTLGVALDSDRDRLSAAITRIKQLLMENEHIDQDTILVYFTDFNEQNLGIFFYFFTKTTVWAEYLEVRQLVNLEILQILEEEGIKLAYPVQRIFFENSSSAEQRVRA